MLRRVGCQFDRLNRPERGVPARRIVVHAAIAYVHAIDNGNAAAGPLLWMTFPRMSGM